MRKFSKIEFSSLFFLSLAAIAFLSHCGGVSSVYYDGRTCLEGVTALSTGGEIYAAACSGCHGSLAAGSAKAGASLSRLNTGISTVATMKFLTCMTEAQKNAVVSALATQ